MNKYHSKQINLNISFHEEKTKADTVMEGTKSSDINIVTLSKYMSPIFLKVFSFNQLWQ